MVRVRQGGVAILRGNKRCVLTVYELPRAERLLHSSLKAATNEDLENLEALIRQEKAKRIFPTCEPLFPLFVKYVKVGAQLNYDLLRSPQIRGA